MLDNKCIEVVKEIEEIELELTIFNSKRALSNLEKKLEVSKFGNCILLKDTISPHSIYYNRVKGFSEADIDNLDRILEVYAEVGIVPCFDMTPNNINFEVATALFNKGFSNIEQLVFMQLHPEKRNTQNELRIFEVTTEQAEEFVEIILDTNNMKLDYQVIQDKKRYFHQPNFKNYIAYVGDEVAGIGSLYISDKTGYIANDYTIEKFRGKGVQKALLIHRINQSEKLNLEALYTDVEFGSISHNNMEKVGFKTVFINSFWCTVDT